MRRDIYSRLVAEARQTLAFRILRCVVLAILGLLVISAQVALPLGSFLSAEEVDYWGTDDDWQTDDWRAFWNARLQFLSIREPWNLPFPWRGPAHVRSLAVCKEELIVLYTTGTDDRRPKAITRGMVRFNLRTGRATTSQPPAGVEHVVSDGEQLWWLPGDALVKKPFLWDGRARDLIRTAEGLTQVVEFIEGKWQKTELFVLLPRAWWTGLEGRRPSRCSTTTESYEFVCNDGDYYKVGVELGTRAQADAYATRFDAEEDGDVLQRMGFHSISNLKDAPDYLDAPIGRWFERGAPCAIGGSRNEHDTVGFQWQRYEAGKPMESKFVVTPIRWQFDPGGILRGAGSFAAVTAPDGKVYIVALGDDDLRIHVLLWENGALRLVAQRPDPMIGRVCLDVGLFLSLACVVPGMVLATGWQIRS